MSALSNPVVICIHYVEHQVRTKRFEEINYNQYSLYCTCCYCYSGYIVTSTEGLKANILQPLTYQTGTEDPHNL